MTPVLIQMPEHKEKCPKVMCTFDAIVSWLCGTVVYLWLVYPRMGELPWDLPWDSPYSGPNRVRAHVTSPVATISFVPKRKCI